MATLAEQFEEGPASLRHCPSLKEQLAALRAENARLREWLENLAWIRLPGETRELCPSCFAEIQDWELRTKCPRQHAPGCELSAALAPGVRP